MKNWLWENYGKNIWFKLTHTNRKGLLFQPHIKLSKEAKPLKTD